MAISPPRLTIYLYSAHRAVIFAIAQLSCDVQTFGFGRHPSEEIVYVTLKQYRENSAALQHCCNDDQQSQWENGDFDPL